MEGLLIISEGQLFMIGAKNGSPVYQPVSIAELTEFLEHSVNNAELETIEMQEENG